MQRIENVLVQLALTKPILYSTIHWIKVKSRKSAYSLTYTENFFRSLRVA